MKTIRIAVLSFACGIGAMAFIGSQPEPVSRVSTSLEPQVATEVQEASTSMGCDLGVVIARQEVDVAAQTEGLLEAVDAEVGATVVAGTVLAKVDVSLLRQELAAERSALTAAKAEARRRRITVRRAEAESARRQSLEGLVSQEELARAAADLEEEEELVVVAEAELDRLGARIKRLETMVERATIRAPFSGKVASRYLDAGARAHAGTPILRLISDGEWRIRFAAQLAWASRLNTGTAVSVEVPNRQIRMAATIVQIAPEIDPPSSRMFVEAKIDPAKIDDDSEIKALRAGEVVWVTEPGSSPCPDRH